MYVWRMRTTVNLDDDIVAAVEELRRTEGVGPSEAINRLARQGLALRKDQTPYVHVSTRLGARVDVSNIGDVLELLDAE
jgi:metal-responsive CopG/Arc/MetJ family transcriptional regulator